MFHAPIISTQAKSGGEGLALVLGGASVAPPDLLLLDCSLPDLSGFDVCKRIREVYGKAALPIIMLSARHNESAIVEGLNAGANDYVTKPFRWVMLGCLRDFVFTKCY